MSNAVQIFMLMSLRRELLQRKIQLDQQELVRLNDDLETVRNALQEGT